MMERARPSHRVAALAAATVVLFATGAAVLPVSRGAFSDTAGNSGNTFTAASASCFDTSSTYDFTGITSPSSTHTAEDGEIDETDTVIENGTFGARRNTIVGWANWGEATTGEYGNLVGSDNLYYQGADPGGWDNAAMIFEFTVAEDPSCITQIDVNVEAAQGGSPGADEWFVYLWDYTTNSYLVGGSGNGTTDQVVSFSVTTNPDDYVQISDGQLTVFVVNKDTDDFFRVDDITVTVTQAPTATLSGTLVPSGTETEIVAGAETLIITLTNDTWDATIGADNAKTTALINGIDSAQSEAAGWDAVVKANMTFNDVTRTSDTVVTITLGPEATYDITAGEMITVTVPATAVASGGPITATPTFDIIPGSGCSPTSTTYDFSGVSSPSSTHTAEDGEIDVTDTGIENGTFSARRNTIAGWANWGEATTAEYSNLVGSDNLYYQGANPGNGDNAAMIFEFTTTEDLFCVTQIDVNVEAAQGGNPFSDLWLVYLWDYTTNSYLVGGSMNGTADQVVSFSVSTNPANYIQTSDGQLTVFVVNEDTQGEIRVDDITVTVTQG